jgi:fucose permease
MTAGVPGSGIGGSFYLLSALLMPVQESVSICRKTSSCASRQAVGRQVLNAMGVLSGVWMTGWFISKSFSKVAASLHPEQQRVITVFNHISLVYGLVTLLAVFLLVQILNVVLRNGPAHPVHTSKN